MENAREEATQAYGCAAVMENARERYYEEAGVARSS